MSVLGGLLAATKKKWPVKFLAEGVISKKMMVIGLAGIVLLLLSSFFDSASPKIQRETSGEKVQNLPVVSRSYEEVLEAKLADILSRVNGAGAVSVCVTLEDGNEQEFAKNITKESRVIQEKDNGGGIRTTTETKENEEILLSKENGGDKPVMVRENKPQIKGVLVIAEGAQDSIVKANLTQAVETGLGISAYKITVLPQRM